MCMVALWVAGGLVGPVVMERLTERLETGGKVSIYFKVPYVYIVR